jgi:hypothetical protein
VDVVAWVAVGTFVDVAAWVAVGALVDVAARVSVGALVDVATWVAVAAWVVTAWVAAIWVRRALRVAIATSIVGDSVGTRTVTEVLVGLGVLVGREVALGVLEGKDVAVEVGTAAVWLADNEIAVDRAELVAKASWVER